jgi:hypothetical protein
VSFIKVISTYTHALHFSVPNIINGSLMYIWNIVLQGYKKMDSTQKLGDTVLWNKDCKIICRLARMWDSRNMRSKNDDSLISVDGLIIDKHVSFFI